MNKTNLSPGKRAAALLLALICILGLFPVSARAADPDVIKLEDFGMSDVSYESDALGHMTMHQMYYDYNGTTVIGFCGTKDGSMGHSLKGQTWGNRTIIEDPTVKAMLAYYYAHSTGTFTDAAIAMGENGVWDSWYT